MYKTTRICDSYWLYGLTESKVSPAYIQISATASDWDQVMVALVGLAVTLSAPVTTGATSPPSVRRQIKHLILAYINTSLHNYLQLARNYMYIL